MPEIFLGDCPVLENTPIAAGIFLLRLRAPRIASEGVPGQFVMVRTGPDPEKGGSPLLKRPFSIHGFGADGDIALLVRMVGVGTGLLARTRPGDSLEILGPLGRGFVPPEAPSRVYLVAGGVGLAPLLPLTETMPGCEKVLLVGARSGAEIPPAEYLAREGTRVELITEDGSLGRRGLVTDLLAEALDRAPGPVYACGPRPMLAAVADLARRYGVEAQVSLEAHMACGMGACLGCATGLAGPDRPAYARVCMEGPVFRAEEIQW